MLCHIARFRQQLASGRVCLGAAVTFADPAVTEALCPAVDFVWIDLEHSPTSLESLQAHLIAARAGGAAAIVRVPGADVNWIKRVLDTGAEGIVVPQIRTAEEVRLVVSACRYPPQGTRGYGPRRGSHYGRRGGADYIRQANAELFVAVQIETAEALASLDAICAVPGLDSLLIGPYDLSGALGRLGEITHPDVLAAIRRTVQAARQAGLFVGMGMAPQGESALQAAELGAQWLQVGGDFAYMTAFADRLFGDIRQRLPGEAPR